MYIYEPVFFGECAIDGSWFSLAATKARRGFCFGELGNF